MVFAISTMTRATKNGLLLFVLLVAQLMVILDITAVNIALPSLASDLDLSGSDISWTITSYSLIFGSLLLFGGRAADLLGRRRMFLTGLGIFTASSFASAMAGTAGALFAARAGQGLGAAMLSPAALAIIMSAFQGNAAGEGARRLGRSRRRRCCDRRARRRRPHRVRRLADDLLRQPPRRSRTRDRRTEDRPGRHSEAALERSRPPRRPARNDESRRDRLRDHAGPKVPAGLPPRRSLFGLGGLAGLAAFAALRAPHRHTAPADRAAGRSRGRRRPLPDARRGRFDLRPLPAQLALPPERARHGAALHRPRLHPARASRQESAPTRPDTSSASTASAARSRERSWSPRPA